ncbi:MAG: type I-D CRISPR-associated protein Cas10d/Csc3 [Blastocatellia bacterium]|nr:type I-D CRISPR-associated protein Cas10d/Csc3 [Blastocatellia bacterium]
MEDESTFQSDGEDFEDVTDAMNDEHFADESREEAEPELLTVKLIREAVRRENPGDTAIDDFARLVVPNMLRELAGFTAKGGLWIERKRAEGLKSDRSGADQSLTAHLLNGLLPVVALIRCLCELDTSVARYLDKKAYRFFIAGYILHDWEKLPGVAARLEARFDEGFKPDPIKHRDVFEEVLTEWAHKLGLDDFLESGGLGSINAHLDTLAWITQNTQERYDTHRPTVGFKLTLSEKVCELCANLTKMADKLASIVKHPADIAQISLIDLLHRLSDGQLRFTNHSLAEVQGVLTNIINNALLDAHRECGWQPFLFFPNGVAYCGATIALTVDPAVIPDTVVVKVRQLCARKLVQRYVGFGRDGKGLKFPDYYWLFFDAPALIYVGAGAASKKLHAGSNPASAKRSASLCDFRRKGLLPESLDVEFGDDIRIDQLAEFCDLVERKVWQEFCKTRKLKNPPDIAKIILEQLELSDLSSGFETISNLNEAIRRAGEKGNTGGVPLSWYYVAAQYFKQPRNKGKSQEDIQELLSNLAASLAEKLKYSIPQNGDDGWGDLRRYVAAMVALPAVRQPLLPMQFLSELGLYEETKQRGGKPCSLCSSSYEVSEQMETGVLFSPQVYTNKQTLFGSQAKRHICNICAVEMMLRQILMNRTQASGGDFEGGKYRYLYIYPTYYFTTETNRFLREMYQKLRATRFRTGVRNHLINRETYEVDFSIARFQSMDSLLTEDPFDYVFKMDYPEDDPLTFFFAGLPPGREATDTESWVMPIFLALTLPFVIDAKVVVSESPVPLFNNGADFEETVFIDAPHSFAELLIAKLRLRLDEILPNLQRLSAAYVIHLDANARQSRGGYDANWGRLSELARDLATSPLYVFHYLNIWLRKQDKPDALPIKRVHEYITLYNYIESENEQERKAMNHARKLTELYRRFYRARGFKSNAILKPIDFAADAVLKADRSLFTVDSGALTDVVAASLNKLLDRVLNNSAEGYSPMRGAEERRQAVREFADYFVNDLFIGALKGDAARLAGQQLNLLRDTCDTLYREMGDRERSERAMATAAAADMTYNVLIDNNDELEA